ncbi:MAG: hypothetical protein SV765_14205 [Pseudomonadota bacterium]|nr:hypothetical protein [Pseudomonadota bacterium]
MNQQIRLPLAGAALLILALGWQVSVILQLNQGIFTYTLDDPYIHLALAENIAAGHYGINPQDHSSPASSILWPLLLSLLATLPGFTLAPLLLNSLFAVGSYAAIYRILHRGLSLSPLGRTLLSLLLCVAFNTLGLVFNGMEHSLHQLLSLWILYGLLLVDTGHRPAPLWILPLLLLNPLVRPEGLALSLLACAYLSWRQQRPAMLLPGLLAIALMLGFGLYLTHLGLDPLPASIQVKSKAVDIGRAVGGRLDVIIANLRHPEGWVVLLGTLLTAAPVWRRRHPLWRLSGLVALCGLAHLLFGRMGWFARYEAYLIAPLYLMVILVYPRGLARLWHTRPWLQRPAFVLVAAILMLPYLSCLLASPPAAHNIYQQHYQMHRLAQSFVAENIAVNDIGFVSLGNPHYVLDLYGLAYTQAFEARMREADPQWMQPLVEARNVRLALLHELWFPQVPGQWVKLGELSFQGPKLTPVDRHVSLYATAPRHVPDLRRRLRRFAATLPEDVSLEFSDELPAG